MKTKLLIVQRYFYNFREGFFDYLFSQWPDIKIINHLKSNGRVIVNQNSSNKAYVTRTTSFTLGNNLVLFPSLFWNLIKINPRIIVIEGGQNTINNIQVYIYSILFNKPYIQWDLGRGYMDEEIGLFRSIYMFIYLIIAKRAKRIFGYNSESRKYFELLNINPRNIVVLNNTVDTISIKKIIDENSTKNVLELNIPDNRIKIIFVGALLPSKNIESLSDLMRILGDNYHLLIIGSGTEEYVAKLKECFVNTNHSFIGYVPQKDLYPYYKVAAFSVLPGLGGLTINQAMAFGVPVLCNKADGAEKDIVFDGFNGYIYSDLKDLVNFINSNSLQSWKVMGVNAQEFLFNKFSLEASVSLFTNEIDKILNENDK